MPNSITQNQGKKSTSFFGKLIIAFVLTLSVYSPAKAQFDVAIGAGTVGNSGTGYPCPIQDWFEDNRAQYLYLASDLNRAGMTAGSITGIRFLITGLNTFSGTVEAYNIKITSTTTSSLSTWITGATQVYGPVNYVPVIGLNSFTFSTPFTWNGTDNIVIEVCNGDATNTSITTYTNNPTVTWTTGLSYNASLNRIADNQGGVFCSTILTPTPSTTRPNIIFAWIPSALCPSTPSPGAASSSVASVCPATPFTLSLPSVSPIGGLDLQWESGPSSTGPWTPIPGATAATYIATQNATTWYRCQLTCSAAGDAPQWSTPVQVTIKPFFDCYCIPASSSGNCQFLDVITNVTFQGINRNSACAGGYSSYTNTDTARAMANATYPISVGVGAGGNFQHVGVWIDFNRNGSFDTNEFTYVGYANGGTISNNITLPAGALPGFTRMRVRVKYLFGSGTPAPSIFDTEPCTTFTFGETEDYTINILPFVVCSGTPNGGSATSTSTVVCAGNNFTLALRNQTIAGGITYQWQSSSNNTTWNPIAGATNQTFTTSTNGDTYYRCAVICSGNTGYSSSVLVTVASCINMPASGSVSTCNGIFYDSGGPNGQYTNNEFRIFTIFPSIPVGKVKAVFTQFSTENNWDGLMIYNGSDTFAPLFSSGLPFVRPTCPAGSWRGTGSPGTITSTASNGALTFVFRSDPSVLAPGWAATISCELPPPCVNAGNPGSTLVNGSSNVTSTQVCVGSGIRLSIQNQQNFLGIRYQWQVSSDGIGYANTSAADTNLIFIPDITATRWYRCLVSCSTAPGSTANSIPVRIILDSTCINMPQSGSWTIDCNGPATTFYDDGGSVNNYSNGQNRTFTIKPNNPTKRLSVIFNTWNLEAGYDFLTIYDGNSTTAPQIGRYSVSPALPFLVTSTAADGSLTFVFTSDNVGNFPGWSATLSCELPPDCISAPTPFNPGSTLATNISVCAGSTTTLTVQNSNYSNMGFEWEVSPDSSSWTPTGATDTLPTFATTITQLRYFRCKVTCRTTSAFEYTIPVKISVTAIGSITGRTGGSVCTDGTVALSAAASAGTILWYADSTGGFPLRTSGALPGNNYTTPFINTTTTYYVSSVVDGGNFSGGRTTVSIPTSGSSSQLGIGFTVSSTIRLNTVKIYSQGSASPISISLFSGAATSGTPLYTAVQFVPSAGWNTVTLNWVIAPGNYTLARSTTLGGFLYRHLASAPNAFPYLIGGRVVLTNGVAGNTANNDYNYFYDWNITGLCESPRLPVVATVSEAPAVSVLGNDPICAGASISLNASSTNSTYAYNWLDNNGNSLASGNRYTTGVLADTITLRLVGADVTAGSPFNGCRDTLTFDVIVNPVPSTVTVTPATATVCSSPILTQLTASGGLIDGVQQPIAWSPSANLFTDAVGTVPYVAGANALTVWAAPISTTTYIATAGTTCQKSGNSALTVVPYGPLNVSIASNAPSNTICAGGSIIFTATPPTGLPSPTYRWQRKTGASWVDVGAFSATSTYTPSSPVTGEIFRAIIKASTTCNPSGVDTALSNQIIITINPTPTVTINGPASVCSGSTNNQYTATISPVGTTTYAWSIAPAGAATVSGAGTATFTINNPTAPFTVNLAATIGGCTGNATGLGVGVNSNTSNSVAAGASTPGPICEGTSVTFTATPTSGGTTPWYQWQVSTNGGTLYSNIGGANAATLVTTTLPPGDLRIRVRMKSSATCPAPDTSNSSAVTLVVNPIPSASTISGPSPVCAGSINNNYTLNILPSGATSSSQTWSATSNGTISGSNTGSSVNINATGSAGTSFTVTANVTRNGCAAIITSPLINISPSVTSGVAITGYTTGSSICPGVSNPLTAVPTPANLPAPVYQWQLSTNGGANWSNVATGNSYSPGTASGNDGDSIRVILVSSGNSCATTPDTAGITLIISSGGVPSVTLTNSSACTGQSVIFTAAALNTSSPIYKFYFNGVLKQSGSSNTYDTTAAAALNNPVRCDVEYTSCASGQATIQSNTITITSLLTAPAVNVSGCSSIVTAGQTVTLSTGTGQTSYQWIRDGVDIGGSTASSVSTAIPANYAVRVTAANGCVVTSSVWALADLRTSPLPNGTYSIPGTGCNSFPDLATVVTRLNTYGISGSGGVVFNIDGAHTETAPIGGFALTANGTSANPIIFQKSGSGSPVFTASASQTAGSLTDAVIKLIGSDYITIKGLTLRENPANATTAAATNNMTEFGVALFRSSVTNGAQNDSIIGNTISLNRTYANSFGIYSNTNHAATDVGTGVVPTSAGGANSNIRIHGNSISNVNFGIAMVGDSSTGRFYDQNVDIGGTSVASGNTLTNWGGLNIASSFRGMPLPSAAGGNTYGIFAGNQVSSNISNNIITSANLNTATAVNTRGIWKSFSTSPTVSLADSITSNEISITASYPSGTFNLDGIIVQGISALATGSLSVNGNRLLNFNITSVSNPTANMINLGSNTVLVPVVNINNNVMRGYSSSAASGGGFTGIQFLTGATVINTLNINNNQFGGSAADSIKTGAGNITIINNQTASGVVNRNINANTISGVRSPGTLTVITTTAGSSSNSVSSNSITGLRAGGATLVGIQLIAGATTVTCNQNTMDNFSASATNSAVYGYLTTSPVTITSNNLTNFSLTNTAGTNGIFGINHNSASAALTATSNTFSGYASASGGTSVVSAVYINSVSTANISKNRIFNLSNSNAAATQFVNAIDLRGTSGTTVNIVNNFISDLRMTAGANGDGVRGISVNSNVTGGSVNVYYNTVYLKASSSGTGFGSSAIYQFAQATTNSNLTLRNNIVVNESTPSGSALVAAFRRSASSQTNYSASSNNNVFFAGTPATNRLLYFDNTNSSQTLSAMQTAIGGNKELASLSLLPAFVNNTTAPFDLHLKTGVNCASDGKGNNSTILIADDIDGDGRSVASPFTTDIGADEFISTGLGEGIWAGVNTDWFDPENWCGRVPTAETNVTIPVSANYPNITSTGATAKDISIAAGAQLNMSAAGSLTSGGNWINNGTVSAAGTVKLASTAGAQTFPGGTGNATVSKLEIDNAAGVTINNHVNITSLLSPLVGTITLSDTITLKSTATATASVGRVIAGTGFAYSGIGKFVIERHINQGRAWRHLSIPVNNPTLSIRDGWQEGAAGSGSNPRPGFGLQITDNRADWLTRGFDTQSPGGPSMKVYDSVAQTYVAVPNTSTPISNLAGYMTFVRGDRTCLSSNAITSSTTLRTSGPIYTGNRTFNLMPTPAGGDPKWVSVGNPYASSVDFADLTTNSPGFSGNYYLWDPQESGSYGVGINVTVADIGGVYLPTPSPTVNYPNNVNVNLQSGQAMFVYNGNATNAQALNFREASKATGSRNVFRPTGASTAQHMLAVIKSVNPDGSSTVLDGFRVVFDDRFMNTVDFNDAIKMMNARENFSVINNKTRLIVEKRKKVRQADSIHIDFTGMRMSSYKIDIECTNLHRNGIDGWLVDRFTGIRTPLNLNGDVSCSVSIPQGIAGASAADRFYILFRKSTRGRENAEIPLYVKQIEGDVDLKWDVDDPGQYSSFEVMHSKDDGEFESVAIIGSQDIIRSGSTFGWTHLFAGNGNHSYMVKAIPVTEGDGQIFSNTVSLKIGDMADMLPHFSVSPNPVENGVINIIPKLYKRGKYEVRLLNGEGKVLVTRVFDYYPGVAPWKLSAKGITSGNYYVNITGGEGKAETLPVLIR